MKKLKKYKYLVLIILIILIVCGASYFGIKQYHKYQTEKIKKEVATQLEVDAKQKAQDETQQQKDSEVEQLKKEVEALKKKKPVFFKTETKTTETNSQNIITLPQNNYYQQSTPDLAKYIVRIICSNGSSINSGDSKIVGGSGTIIGSNKFIMTNFHVVDGAVLCKVGITDDIKNPPSQWYEATIATSIPSLDIASLKPTQILPDSVNAVVYNICPSEEIKLGDEIIVLGYPGVGGNTITATEGVISGFEGYRIKTSAKIEHGNSGGGAFLKKNGCWFGIPTSVTIGELESLGSIINYSLIHEQSQ